MDKFEHDRGNKFSTYAYWWIKQSVDRAIQEKGDLIRIPLHLSQTRRKVASVAGHLSQRLGRQAAPREIADQIDLPAPLVEQMLRLGQAPVRLDEHGEERNDPLQSLPDPGAVYPSRPLEQREVCSMVRQALKSLNPREEQIICLRFGIGDDTEHTLEEVGHIMRLSRERVRQIQSSAMHKLHALDAMADLLRYSYSIRSDQPAWAAC